MPEARPLVALVAELVVCHSADRKPMAKFERSGTDNLSSWIHEALFRGAVNDGGNAKVSRSASELLLEARGNKAGTEKMSSGTEKTSPVPRYLEAADIDMLSTSDESTFSFVDGINGGCLSAMLSGGFTSSEAEGSKGVTEPISCERLEFIL